MVHAHFFEKFSSIVLNGWGVHLVCLGCSLIGPKIPPSPGKGHGHMGAAGAALGCILRAGGPLRDFRAPARKLN